MSEDHPHSVGLPRHRDAPAIDPNLHPLKYELISVLLQMRLWIRLISVLLTMASIGTVALSICLLISQQEVDASITSPSHFVYLVPAALLVYPAVCLHRCVSRITDAEQTSEMAMVVAAIRQQKNFWRYCGTVFSVLLMIYVLVLALLVALELMG